MANRNTAPESLYGTNRDYLREQERKNEILAEIAGEEYEVPGDIPKGKYVLEKRLLDAAQKENELLEAIADGSGTISGANKLAIDYGTDILSLNKGDTPIENSGVTLPAYGVSFDPTSGGLTLTKNGTALSGQTVTIPNYGSPVAVEDASDMTDHDKIYLYEGTTGATYTNGHFYYWDGEAWADGGEYAAATVQTDKTLLVEDRAADAKATGEAVGELKNALNEIASFPTMDVDENVAYSCPVAATTDRLVPTWELDDIRPGVQLYWNVDAVTASVHSSDFTNLNIRAVQYDSNDTVLSRTSYPTTLTINANAVRVSFGILYSKTATTEESGSTFAETFAVKFQTSYDGNFEATIKALDSVLTEQGDTWEV